MFNVKAISNYVATLITVSIIFSSVFFVFTTMMMQSRVGTQSFIKMAEMVDKAREAVSMDYVVNGRNLTLMVFNKGDVDVTLSKIVIIDNKINNYTFTLDKTIFTGSIAYTSILLPVDFNQIISMKLITARGNVFDILARREQLIPLKIETNAASLSPNDTFRITITVTNTIGKTIIIDMNDVHVSFINRVDSSDVTDKFRLIKIIPSAKIALTPGSSLIIRCDYVYAGGLNPGTPLDARVNLKATTVDYELLYAYSSVVYILLVS